MYDSITFTADVFDAPEDAVVIWIKDGHCAGSGETFTVECVTLPFTVQAKLDGTEAESAVFEVYVSSNPVPFKKYFRIKYAEQSDLTCEITTWFTFYVLMFFSSWPLLAASKLGFDPGQGVQGVGNVASFIGKTTEILGTPFRALNIVLEWLWNTVFKAW